jgi:signal transduction histidine kinase
LLGSLWTLEPGSLVPNVRRMSIVSSEAPSFPLAIEQIAADLRSVVGACWCMLVLDDSTQIILSSAEDQDAITPPWSDDHVAFSFLQDTLRAGAATTHQLENQQLIAVAFPPDRPIGAAALGFRLETKPELGQVRSAVQLATRAVELTRQLDGIQAKAEQIVEGMRVREIQRSRNLLRGVIDSVPIGLALIDIDSSIMAVNRALAERFNREPVGMVGLYYDQVIGLWAESPAAQTFAAGMPQRLRYTRTKPDRSQELLEITSFPIFDSNGLTAQVVEVWEDITERVTLQTQLVRAEKLAAIGQLAASIAHEVGNPLQAIQGFLALFLEQSPPDTPNQYFLKLAEGEIQRIVQVLARLRDLYRPRAEVVEPTDLNDLVEGVLLLTSKQLERTRIRVHRELAEELPPLIIIADQIKQVLLNLVLNAAEAMGTGGMLHIQTYLQHERSGMQFVTVTITDTGEGIGADQLPYIFDGLHTTKERGMGLGLYTSKAIVERHMGRIQVQSVLGEGTTFVITLPVQEAELVVQM